MWFLEKIKDEIIKEECQNFITKAFPFSLCSLFPINSHFSQRGRITEKPYRKNSISDRRLP